MSAFHVLPTLDAVPQDIKGLIFGVPEVLPSMERP